MKWIFYVVVFVYMFYRAVYGLKNEIGSNNAKSLDENADHGDDGIFVEAGERKIISCKGSGKNQKIEWLNPNGQVISRLQSQRVHVSPLTVPSPRAQGPSLLLNISKAEVDDSGVWTCRAGDIIRIVSLCVIDPTAFEGTPSEVSADEGRSFTLSCQTSGEPEAAISWMRDGRVISEFEYEDTPKYRVMTKYNSYGIEGLLTVMSLTVEDSGVYTCQSTQETQLADKCGTVRKFDITLNVNYAPSFGDKTKENVYGTESEILELRCEAVGYPQPTYQWSVINGGDEPAPLADSEIVDADNGSASVLSIKVTENTFNEQYICQASNKLGEVELVFNVLESVKPKKPDEVEVLPDLSSSKTLGFNISWEEEIQFEIGVIEAQTIPSAMLSRKKVRETDWKHSTQYNVPIGEVLESSITAVIGGLEQETEYWVRLRIKNDVGNSPWSNPVKAKTNGGEVDEAGVTEEETKQEVHSDGEDETEATESESEATQEDSSDTTEEQLTPPPEASGRFYGLFFAVGVLIVAVGCTFVVRMI